MDIPDQRLYSVNDELLLDRRHAAAPLTVGRETQRLEV